ncbi:MAG: hemolysin family protein [Halanaerobiaceae bacterium]
MVLNVIIFAILIFLSAFFSGSETALMSVNKIRVKELVSKGDKKAALVNTLLKDNTKLLTTLLIGNNLVNIAASALATSLAIFYFGSNGVGIATGIVTLLVLIFGEIIPKALGSKRSVKFSRTVASYIYWLEKILFPFVAFFSLIIKFFVGQSLSSSLSEEEVRRFVNVSEKEGVIKEIEKKMINNIFEFDDTMVKEIMVPRIDMVCVNEEMKFTDFVSIAVEKGYSRIPVYRETIDNISGVIYVKDLLEVLLDPNVVKHDDILLKDFIRPAYFIHESKRINELLAEMKKRKVHMSIILDEYGGVSGLVTIEDLLEEIVGEIQDEYDLEPKVIEFLSENEVLLDARIDIDELNEILIEPLGVDDDYEYETIGGFILYQLGYFPKKGEELKIGNLKIIIEETKRHRINKVRIVSDDLVKKFDAKNHANI